MSMELVTRSILGGWEECQLLHDAKATISLLTTSVSGEKRALILPNDGARRCNCGCRVVVNHSWFSLSEPTTQPLKMAISALLKHKVLRMHARCFVRQNSFPRSP